MGFIADLISLRGFFEALVLKTNRSELRAIHLLKREAIKILGSCYGIMLYVFIRVCLNLESCVRKYCDWRDVPWVYYLCYQVTKVIPLLRQTTQINSTQIKSTWSK